MRARNQGFGDELTPPELTWVLERLPSAVYVVGEDLGVRFVNLAGQRLARSFGVRLRAGRPLLDLGESPSLRELAEGLFRRRGPVEGRLQTDEGRMFAVQGFRHKDEPIAVLHLEETTERERLQQAEENFLVNASHEFLSPLTSIAAAAHVLGEGGHDPDIRRQFVGNIVQAADRLVHTSRALLILARAEAGAELPLLERLLLRPLLEDTFAPERSTGCDVTIDCPGDAVALVDRDLLGLALGELRDNACRHALGTTVVVSVAGRDARGFVEIEVRSDGSRLPADIDLARMTRRFVSGEGRDSRGHGVGLSIADRASRLLGGRLSLQLDAEQHLRARIEVPAAARSRT